MGSREELRLQVEMRLGQLEGGLAVAPGGAVHSSGELEWLRRARRRTWYEWGRWWACLWLAAVWMWGVTSMCCVAVVVGHLLSVLRWVLRSVRLLA